MQHFAVWQQAGLRKLVEGINADLRHEEQQKNTGDLEKSAHVNEMSEAGPAPGKETGSAQTQQRAREELLANLHQH